MQDGLFENRVIPTIHCGEWHRIGISAPKRLPERVMAVDSSSDYASSSTHKDVQSGGDESSRSSATEIDDDANS